MLKRAGVLTILLLYLVTASGFALNLHYCGKLVTSVKLGAPASKCFPSAMKCCRDQHIEVKVKDAHQSAAANVTVKLFIVDMPYLPGRHALLTIQHIPSNLHNYRGPPRPPGCTDIYIKNCIFRI